VEKRGGKRFVIQKHAASRLHYDFRLELGGTLKSWALPKGMPYEKGEKRLAVHVEDHPVSYIDFEGSIPQGQYGGGTVMVWDRGTFSPDTATPLKDLEKGKLHFSLEGKKLKGEWHLVRMRGGDEWLMIRGGENLKPVSAKQEDLSVLSGKTMRQLAENGRVWKSGKTEKTGPPPLAEKIRRRASGKGRRGGGLPAFVKPMKARLEAEPPREGNWIYEVKFDGFRALALLRGGNARLISRNEKTFDEKFPEILEAVKSLEVQEAVLDGEIVALDSRGKSSFQLLQAYELGEEKPTLAYYVFDLLRLGGKDWCRRPLAERKTRLEELLQGAPAEIRYSASLEGDGGKLLKQAAKLGLEGLIGKRAGSVYEPGRRSGAWIKLKLHREQEFVIGGFTPPEGTRKHFGALLVGVREGGDLVFTGKVGTGFNHRMLASLHQTLAALETTGCPFANLPEKRSQRYGQAITASVMRTCHWVKPKLVCQVKFGEWTRDGRLRQPVFLGLREDKDPSEVVREKAE
jgi:bifunctional non-homologous end joining protein LigD